MSEKVEVSADSGFEGLEVSAERPNVLGRQLLRSATSVGAQYREGCRARSKAEFISKLESALQEAAESDYWLEILAKASLAPEITVAALRTECNEIIRLMVSSVRTTKANRKIT